MEEKPNILKSVEGLINGDRVINFSDAVFAFAATLLILKINLPQLTESEVNSSRLAVELINLWPSYLANIISFLVIAYYWLIHHAIFSLIRKFDSGIIWLNLIFLIFLSFIPFPVDLFGEYSNSDVIVGFYSFSLAVVGSLLGLLWIYALNKKLTDPDLSPGHIHYYTARFLLAPLIFAISTPLSFIDPLLSKISWAFVIIGIMIINKSFKFKRISVIEKNSL